VCCEGFTGKNKDVRSIRIVFKEMFQLTDFFLKKFFSKIINSIDVS